MNRNFEHTPLHQGGGQDGDDNNHQDELYDRYLIISEIPDDAGDKAGVHAILQVLYEMGDTLNEFPDVSDVED